jgi:hypothetical protein
MEHKYLRDTELFKNLSIPLRANITLLDWQRLGITFLDFNRRKLGFAILADEMGVGKVGPFKKCNTDEQTLQCLGTVHHMVNEAKIKGDVDQKALRRVNFVFWYLAHIPVFVKTRESRESQAKVKRESSESPRLTSRILANGYSPVTLASNWVNETTKFFERKDLRARLWSLDAWKADDDISTVWIVKISHLRNSDQDFVKLFSDPAKLKRIEVMSTWSDEAHVFGRSDTSYQNRFLRQFTRQSRFNVLITGTLFPLGPSHDAVHVLTSMGGPIGGAGKWTINPELLRALVRIFDPTPARKLRQLPLLPIRVLIAPFVLRRTASSTWNGVFVIKRTIARPTPQVIVPPPDDYTSAARIEFKRQKRANKNRKESAHQRMERADNMRLYAWSPLYKTFIEKLEEYELATNRKHPNPQKLMEEVIKKGLAGKDFERTSRMETSISLVKKISQKGERFLIVADRIFPLTLSYWVSPFKTNCL